MIVNFEFLGNDAFDNVITCMNHKVDKVVFFGYHETIQSQKESADKFLRKYCGVKKTAFFPLSHTDLQSILKTMRTEIEYELSQGNKLFFDITGGESLILVAFGMLAKEFKVPLHQYDVLKNKLIEFDEGATTSLSKDVEAQSVKLNLDSYVEMHGGIINTKLQKDIKGDNSKEFVEDVAKIWQVAKNNIAYWNPFSDFLRKSMVPDENLRVIETKEAIEEELVVTESKIKTTDKLNEILDALAEIGILLNLEHTEERYSFQFKSIETKNCIWEGGSVLELHTYQEEKQKNEDCRVGVHIDWDGVIHTGKIKDVFNEMDVLTLTGNVATFISCKSGKMGMQQSLFALYELQTVAERFGGKYAKKVLRTAMPLGKVYMERAKEMGIEVVN